jgi:hypothetical protein
MRPCGRFRRCPIQHGPCWRHSYLASSTLVLESSGAEAAMNSHEVGSASPLVVAQFVLERFKQSKHRLTSRNRALSRSPRQLTVAQASLGKSGSCGYTLAMMNDAIKPAPSRSSARSIVPTCNTRDNVTVHRLPKVTRTCIFWEVVFLSMIDPPVGRVARLVRKARLPVWRSETGK